MCKSTGSTKENNTIVDTLAIKNDGHKMADKRCASGRGLSIDMGCDGLLRMSWCSRFRKPLYVGGQYLNLITA